MTACTCDWDYTASLYVAERRTARKTHRCKECGRQIQPGEIYEHVRGIWDGMPDTVRTCPHCLAIRDWVTAHVPCSCWSHHSLLEDMHAEISAYAHQAPGLAMGYLRRVAAMERARGMVRIPGAYVRSGSPAALARGLT